MEKNEIIKKNNNNKYSFQILKEKIAAEMARRGDIKKKLTPNSSSVNQNPNNLNISDQITQNFSETLNQNEDFIKYSQANETINLLRKITTNPNGLKDKKNRYDIIPELQTYINLVEQFSQYGKTDTPAETATGDARYMGCNGACRGLCSKSCYSACSGSCTGSNTTHSDAGSAGTLSCSACGWSSCDGNCASGCSNCEQVCTGCGNACATSVDGSTGVQSTCGCGGNSCKGECADGCTGGCGHSCIGSCSRTCGYCAQGCNGGCKNVCKNLCGYCDSTCSQLCSDSCKNGCSINATGGTNVIEWQIE